MTTKVFAVYFEGPDEFQIALGQLVVARVATAALLSHVVMRTEVFAWHDEDHYRLLIDISEDGGRTFNRILIALLDHQIGKERFTVCPAFEADIRKVSEWKQYGCA
jgi:hypothetical protein